MIPGITESHAMKNWHPLQLLFIYRIIGTLESQLAPRLPAPSLGDVAIYTALQPWAMTAQVSIRHPFATWTNMPWTRSQGPCRSQGPGGKDRARRVIARTLCRREPRTVHAWAEPGAKSRGPKSKSHKDQEPRTMQEPRIMLGSK